MEFPQDPYNQLRLATEAVFKSWNGKRAIDYRNAAGIAHDLGTAVNIVTMVFGNMGETSATGVAMTRNGSTGEKNIEGDYLTNAQGEDVVAGIRMTRDISQLKDEMPEVYARVERYRRTAGKALPGHAGHGIHHRRGQVSGCSRPAMANAPPRRPCASPWIWPKRA